jgi:hypothetical protein
MSRTKGIRLFWITHSFFKVKSNAKVSNSIEKSRLWLNLTNTQGAFKQTLIGYIAQQMSMIMSMTESASMVMPLLIFL